MITEKVKSIINSCKTHLQLDTCSQWVEHVFDHENQKVAQAVIQQKRNEIDRVNSKFAPDHISHVQSLEH